MPELAKGADLIADRVEASLDAKRRLLDGPVAEQAAELADAIGDALEAGNKVLLFGNGGSAADAMHLAAEFVGRFKLDRAALPALSLTDNVASITGVGNDYAFDEIFSRGVGAFGQPGDVAIGLSTSGASANVLAGLRTARDGGLLVVGVTGADGGGMDALCDRCLRMPSRDTARVQECYMLVLHAVCELVERRLFARP
jgi:D-sedoheptulose 7-phosphate isomerase